MSVATVEQFFELLQKSNLLAAGQLAAVQFEARRSWLNPTGKTGGDGGRGANAITPEYVARKLVERELLTKWQADMLLLGRQAFFLGKYKLLEQVGSGGMGAVFKAQHVTMGRIVALKIMSPNLVKNATAVARFHLEMQAAAKLDHPHIIAAYDADCVRDAHFLVMEYVAGQDLGRVLRRNSVLPIGWSCEVIRQAALGLQHAHECGMVHRDIKPNNLLISKDDGSALPHVKILDMGLSRFVSEIGDDSGSGLTQTGVVIGTPDYIAPEQAANTRSADIRSDIFSLGCTLFRMVTGRLPYAGINVMEKLMARAMNDAPHAASLRPEIPPGLDDVIAKMLARDPNQRFQTPNQVAAALAPFSLLATMGGAPSAGTNGLLEVPHQEATLADNSSVASEDDDLRGIEGPTREFKPEKVSGTVFPPGTSVDQIADQRKVPDTFSEAKVGTELGLEVFLQHLATEAEQGETPSLARRIVEQSANPQPRTGSPPAETPPTESTRRAGRRVARKPVLQRFSLRMRAALRDNRWRVAIGVVAGVLIVGVCGLAVWNWSGQTKLVIEWLDEDRTDGRLELDGQEQPLATRGDLVFEGAEGTRRLVLTRPGYEPIEKSFDLQRRQRVVFAPEWVQTPLTRRRIELAELKQQATTNRTAEPWHEPTAALRTSLADFRRRYAGTEDALSATKLLVSVPSPLSRFDRTDIDTIELQAAAIGQADKSPVSLVAILGSSRFKHWGPVRSLAFGRQGQWLASAGDDQTIRLWNVSTGELLRTLDVADRGLLVEFSPDGRFVAVTGDNSGVLLWRTDSGEVLKSGGTGSLPVRNESRPSGGRAGEQLPSGTPSNPSRRSLRDSAWPVAFSPGGKTVITHSRTGQLLLWDLDTGEKLLTFAAEHASQALKSLVFSADGQRVASYSRLDQTVRVWRVATGDEERAFPRAHWPVFRPGGSVLAAETENDVVTLWNVETGEVVGTLRGAGRPLRFNADGSQLATHVRGEMHVWNVTAARERGPARQVGELLRISPSLQTVAEWDDPATPHGAAGGLEFLRLTSAGERRTSGHPGGVFAAEFDPESAELATGGGDHAIRMWSPATGAERRPKAALPGIVLCDIHPDGGWLALACDDATVRLLELGEKSSHQKWKPSDTKVIHEAARGVTALRFSPDGKTLAAIGDWDVLADAESKRRSRKRPTRDAKDAAAPAPPIPTATLKLWNVASGTELALPGTDSRGAVQNLRCLGFSPDGKSLAAGTSRSTVLVWDPASLAARGTFFKHSGRVECLSFSPNGKQVASAGTDRAVLIWNPLTGSVQHTLESDVARGPARATAFHPEGKLLATGGDDNFVTVWDTASGESKHELRVPGGLVRSLAFSPLGDQLASSNAAGQVHLWNVPIRSQRVAEPDVKLDVGPSGGLVRQVLFAPDGRHLLVVNGNGTLYVFRLRVGTGQSSLAKVPPE
ncbi:MAG: protein kinase [Planctomycetales bacterium]|nr:protein kinase [Planctomycetales bacterium]